MTFGIGAELAHNWRGERGSAPIHVPPLGGGRGLNWRSNLPLTRIGARIGAELAQGGEVT